MIGGNPLRQQRWTTGAPKTTNSHTTSTRSSRMIVSMFSSATPTETMSKAVSEALSQPVELVSMNGGGGGLSSGGGGGATTAIVTDKLTNAKYFVKSARNKYEMLRGEYTGVQAMANTNTIRVPTPIAYGKHETTHQAYCIFEYIEFVSSIGRDGLQFQLGVELAKVRSFVTMFFLGTPSDYALLGLSFRFVFDGYCLSTEQKKVTVVVSSFWKTWTFFDIQHLPPKKLQMHRHTSEQGFGFVVNNTIGATFQPNHPWMDDWAEFWDECRL